jgi:membrane protease YdiL (CAAX protease family)
MKNILLKTIAAVLHDIRHMKKLPLKIIIIKIIIVIACVVGFAFVAAFIGLVAYDLHLTGKHYGCNFLPGVTEALWGLCIGAIIGGVVGYKIIKPKPSTSSANTEP